MERDSKAYFYKIKPHPGLAHLIKFYWVLKDRSPAAPRPEWMLPDPYSEIIFNRIKAPYHRLSKGEVASQICESYVIASNGSPVQAAKIEAIDMVGIKLLPHALQAIVGCRVNELTRPVSLLALGNATLKRLADKLMQDMPEAELKMLLDEAMFNLLSSIKTPLVFQAMDLQVRQRGLLRIDALAEQVGINISTLEKGFKKYVGISPKAFQKMVRFRNFYQSQLQSTDLEEKPHFYDFGYYDQNHLIKEFKYFTGRTPSQSFLQSAELSFEITNQHFGRDYWAF